MASTFYLSVKWIRNISDFDMETVLECGYNNLVIKQNKLIRSFYRWHIKIKTLLW